MLTISQSTTIAVDPSMRSLGIAVAYDDVLAHSYTLEMKLPTSVSDQVRSLRTSQAVYQLLRPLTEGPTRAVLEVPANWGSGKGLDSRRSGSIQKLFYTAGAISHALSLLADELWFVEPGTWKGQLDKGKMVARAKRVAGVESFASHDEAEAVMLLHRFVNRSPEQRGWMSCQADLDLDYRGVYRIV